MPNLRRVQQILHNVQTSLLRIPGVCSNEAQQMGSDLREVAQLVSTESSQLIDGLVNMRIDAQVQMNDCARMGVDSTLQKANLDRSIGLNKELERQIAELKQAAVNDREKIEKLEKERDEIKNDLKMISDEFARFRDKVQEYSGSPTSRDDLVKVSFPLEPSLYKVYY